MGDRDRGILVAAVSVWIIFQFFGPPSDQVGIGNLEEKSKTNRSQPPPLAAQNVWKTIIREDYPILSEQSKFGGHTGAAISVAFSPDGRLAASGDEGGTIRLLDLKSAAFLREFRQADGGTRAVRCIAFVPDGRRLVSANDAGALHLWDVETGEDIRLLGDGEIVARDMYVSRDGRFVLVGGQYAQESTRFVFAMYDVATGAVIKSSEGEMRGLNGLRFSTDGRRAVLWGGCESGLEGGDSAYLGLTAVWDLEQNWRELCRLETGINPFRGEQMLFLSRGDMVLSASENELWNLAELPARAGRSPLPFKVWPYANPLCVGGELVVFADSDPLADSAADLRDVRESASVSWI